MKSGEQIRQVRGTGIAVRGNDIDTDVIMPARFLKAITFAGLEEHVFADVRFAADGSSKGHPFDRREFASASILIVNANFGCGSSREHAPQGLRRWGIRAIVGESFSEIFFGNCVSIGLPAVTASPEHVASLMDSVELDPGQALEVDLEALCVRSRAGVFPAALPAAARARLMAGEWDSLGQLLSAKAEINRVCDALPYVRGF
jgi:3-isopropylmalate/(R)-2-methylmalate dehydratase small subunit